MANVTGFLTKQVGPLPMGLWLVLGGVGAFVALRSAKSEDDAPVAVEPAADETGALETDDDAKMVISPVVRINVPEIDTLTGAIIENTKGLGSNTGALGQNTSALTGNTGALQQNTGALGANTGAVNTNTGAVNGLTGAVNQLTGKIGSIPVSAPAAPAPAPAPAARTYTIRSGDTLWDIAKRYTGNANRWPELYRANAGTIDSVARSRGKAGGGHWIFPGTVLTLPW